MSNRNMSLDVIVRLRDRLSRGLRRVTGQLKRFAKAAAAIGLVAGAITALSFVGPAREAAAFQQQLLDIAGTAEKSGKAAFEFAETARRQYEDLALAVGQSSDDIAAGAGAMIAAGLDLDVVSGSLMAVGRSATAANAEFADMSEVSISLLKNLRLPVDQLEDALGALVKAGKEGAFELKDMSRFFPTLTGQIAKFGITGREAVNFLGSALQIARLGTSDASTAANNLRNFLSKVLSPQTVKNFRKMGVDIQAVMQDAAVKGINPIEAVLQKIVKLTGVSGNEIDRLMARAKKNGLEGAEALGFVRQQLEAIYGAGRLGNLFQDQQVLDFLIPFLANVDEFKRIRDDVAGAGRATIGPDFETQMKGANRQLVRFDEIMKQIRVSLGLAFGQWLPVINDGLAAMLGWFRDLDAETNGFASAQLTAAGGVVALAAVIGALGLALPVVTAGFAAIGAVLAAVLTPLGAAIGLLVGAGVLIWRNWNRIGPRLSRGWRRLSRDFSDMSDRVVKHSKAIGSGFRSGLEPHTDAINKNLSGSSAGLGRAAENLGRLAKALGKLTGINSENLSRIGEKLGAFFSRHFGAGATKASKSLEAVVASLSSLVELDFKGIGEGLGTFAGRLAEFGSSGLNAVSRMAADLTDVLAGLAERVANGASLADVLRPWAMKAKDAVIEIMNEMIEWFRGLPGRILSAIGSIDLSSLIKWPSLPSWLGGGSAAPDGPIIQGAPFPQGPKPSIGLGKPANSNVPGKQSSLAPRAVAAVPRQPVDVSGVIRVEVAGPGKVTATSSNSQVKLAPNRGRAVGRV